MSFYPTLAQHYSQIFPLAPTQLARCQALFAPGSRVLDVGCATALLANALQQTGYHVVGIDPDATLLAQAQAPGVDLRPLALADLPQHFGPGSFDGIVCVGNTLAHLPSYEALEQAMAHFRYLLAPGGRLLMQLVHYDYIFAHGITQLPPIETDALRFDRHYRLADDSPLVHFEVQLHDKRTGQQLRTAQQLTGHRRWQIDQALQRAQLRADAHWANFAAQPLAHDSLLLVVAATAC